MKCEYCLSEKQSGEFCEKCGAPLSKQSGDLWKSEPFFYNGYICYTLRDLASGTYEVQFWLGRELLQRICVPIDFVRIRVPQGDDAMPFFWELFIVAQGEKEVIEFQEMNKKYPARFEVRRIENQELEQMRGMNFRELARVLG